MLFRSMCGLVLTLTVGSLLLADETRGTVTKIESGSITIRTGGGFGKKKADAEEKTFRISPDIKISRTFGKDKDKADVKLTLDELKTAVKVTNVFVTITHEGENGSEIKVGGGFGGGNFGKKKKKDNK